MLVLTRKVGQKILMNNGVIQMKVLKIKDDVISMGAARQRCQSCCHR